MPWGVPEVDGHLRVGPGEHDIQPPLLSCHCILECPIIEYGGQEDGQGGGACDIGPADGLASRSSGPVAQTGSATIQH